MWGGEIFVPKIHSYRVVDLAEAVAPKCKHEFIGLRSGEKLHEEMITLTDSMNTVEFEDYFVIMPDYKQLEWDKNLFIRKSNNTSGKLCKDNFSYNSGTNENFLSINEIKRLIKANIPSEY